MRSKIQNALKSPFRADFVKLPVSGSYHTLFRRIEAMKQVQQISRGKFVLLCSALAVIGMLVIVPWRVVAQDPNAPPGAAAQRDPKPQLQPSAKPENEQKPTATPEALAKTPADKAAADKLIGAWRAGNGSGKLTFNADGTFTEFPSTLPQMLSGGAPGMAPVGNTTALKGTWQIVNGGLELTWKTFWQQASDSGEARVVSKDSTTKLQIAKLDPTFLRLTLPSNQEGNHSYTIFFRRVEAFKLDTLKGKLPEEILKVAELSSMDSQEAESLDKWMKSVPKVTENLQLIEQVAAAKNAKLSIAELLKLSPEEDKSLAALKSLTPRNINQLIWLADQGLLEEKELKAVKRIESFVKQFNSLAYSINSPALPGFMGGYGRGNLVVQGIIPDQQSSVDSEAALKLRGLIDGLGNWLFLEEGSPLLGGEAIQPSPNGT
jgi:hypothetical protein